MDKSKQTRKPKHSDFNTCSGNSQVENKIVVCVGFIQIIFIDMIQNAVILWVHSSLKHSELNLCHP